MDKGSRKRIVPYALSWQSSTEPRSENNCSWREWDITSREYNQKDAEGSINLFVLPLKVRALMYREIKTK
jgi:hypothetical protein